MWPWIRRWLDWVMSDVLPLTRRRPHGQALHTRYEKAGLTLYDLPIPWNAEAVVVELLLNLPPMARQKSAFTLRLPGREPILSESMRGESAPLIDFPDLVAAEDPSSYGRRKRR